jgi:hypothetical protein
MKPKEASMNRSTLAALVLLCASAACASAQMTVHAVTGTLKAVAPGSISVTVGSGPAMTFAIQTSSKPSLDLASDLRASSSAPGSLHTLGDFVLVYYYGFDSQRTAVAVKDLGAGPFTKAQGTVLAFDKHTRILTLKDAAGKQTSLLLDNALIIDTDMGVTNGRKFTPHRGDQIRVTYTAGTPPTVAFLGESL